MAFITLGIPTHNTIQGVSPTDHHTATVAADISLADLAARAHSDLSDEPVDAHHDNVHTFTVHTIDALEFARVSLFS